MTGLMKGKGLNEVEKNLLMIFCLYLSLKEEYNLPMTVFYDLTVMTGVMINISILTGHLRCTFDRRLTENIVVARKFKHD